MISLLGIIILPLVAWLLSTNRSAINLRTVLIAFAIQALIGGFVLYFPPGKQLLSFLAEGVSNILGYSTVGIDFLFGNLSDQGWNNIGFVFAIQVLPVIVFFASLIAVLYHLHIMEWVIRIIGGALQFALKTSRARNPCLLPPTSLWGRRKRRW